MSQLPVCLSVVCGSGIFLGVACGSSHRFLVGYPASAPELDIEKPTLVTIGHEIVS